MPPLISHKVIFVCLKAVHENLRGSENSWCIIGKLTVLCFFTQGISLSPFGGLFSYPYHYMTAPAAIAPALPTCSATSALARSHCLHSTRPWLRFNPYLIPTSVTSSQNLLTTRSADGPNSQSEPSKSQSKESDNHSHKTKAKQKTSPLKNIIKGSINELQNIQNLVRGLDKPPLPQ